MHVLNTFQALDDLSNGETNQTIRDLEAIDFDNTDTKKLLIKIQKDVIDHLKNEMHFYRNLAGKNLFYIAKEWYLW